MLLSVTISSTQLPELAAPSRQSTATTVTNIPITSLVVSDHEEDASGVPEPVTRKQHAGLADSIQRPPSFGDSDCKKIAINPKPDKYGEPAGKHLGMIDYPGRVAYEPLHKARAQHRA
ncbi:hypothetical protein [Bradyrhizobium yuanmingense]|uniref:hypothetical protein n=1 Tax=Bradyrhizobium yuanmingense TaxID=108015 RepID=UPI001CD3D8C2|nr:hypothetical protein [Bradyrhizobium yuanmingense]MCA1525782.1 hypothetical protein [Bradyrhizobium yuanmingense]